MYDEKLLTIAKRLKEEHIIMIRLYNALYKITNDNKQYTIQQEGLDTKYHYKTLKELFENYVVYGEELINQINDIKIF